MSNLLDKIMEVLTRFDESSSAYITPTQEPFVRKELEEVLEDYQIEKHECFYSPDNTTAMNCIHCGAPKFMHSKFLT